MGRWTMTLLRRYLFFALALVSGWGLHATQNAPAKGDAEPRSTIAGVWRGHSECAVKNSPCHDEVNVYRFSKIEGRENVFSVTASKLVDGKEVVMGSSEWKYEEKRGIVASEKPSIQLAIHEDIMEGALKLEDGTVYR